MTVTPPKLSASVASKGAWPRSEKKLGYVLAFYTFSTKKTLATQKGSDVVCWSVYGVAD